MVEVIKSLILVAALGGGFFSRKWCLPIFCFFLPLSQWMPDIPIPAVNAMNLLLIPVLFQAISAGKNQGESDQRDPLLFPAGLFLFFVFISWARVQLSSDLPVEWVRGGGLMENVKIVKEIANAFVFYFCARRLTVDPEDRNRVLMGIMGGFAFEAFTATREFLVGSSWRATAHLGQPNRLGAFLAGYMMLPFGFLMVKGAKYRFHALILVMAGCLGLLGAVSRGALLSICVAVLLTALMKRHWFIIPLALVLFSAPLWLPEKVMQRFDEATVESETGDVELKEAGRIELWKVGMDMIADNPLGVGLEQYRFNLRKYGYQGRRVKTAHNIYMSLAAEMGVHTFLMHVFIMAYLGLTAFRLSSTGYTATDRCIGMGMFGMVIAFMVGSFFGDGFYENNLSGNFWIMAGITMTTKLQKPPSSEAKPPTGPRAARNSRTTLSSP